MSSADPYGMPESDVHVAEMKLNAVRAQHRLAQVLQWPEGQLPLPTSQPHAGTYNARYDEIYAGRFHRRAWELDRTLPLLYDVMTARAAVLSRRRSDAVDFSRAANEFLDVVSEYNLAIAEYALLAAGDSLVGRDLVPLLIRVDRDDDQVADARTGRTARPPQRQRRMASVPAGSENAPRSRAATTNRQQSSRTGSPDDGWRRSSGTLEGR